MHTAVLHSNLSGLHALWVTSEYGAFGLVRVCTDHFFP